MAMSQLTYTSTLQAAVGLASTRPSRMHHAACGLIRVVGFVAVALAAANVVGGFVVTDRMLEMFKKRRSPSD